MGNVIQSGIATTIKWSLRGVKGRVGVSPPIGDQPFFSTEHFPWMNCSNTKNAYPALGRYLPIFGDHPRETTWPSLAKLLVCRTLKATDHGVGQRDGAHNLSVAGRQLDVTR